MIDPAVWVTVAIFLLIHLIASVWWAAAITTTLKILQRDFAEMNANVSMMKELYIKKEDYNTRVAIIDREREAMWKKIDKLNEKMNHEQGDNNDN